MKIDVDASGATLPACAELAESIKARQAANAMLDEGVMVHSIDEVASSHVIYASLMIAEASKCEGPVLETRLSARRLCLRDHSCADHLARTSVELIAVINPALVRLKCKTA